MFPFKKTAYGLFFWPHHEASGILFPEQGLNLGLPKWKNRVLTVGPPGIPLHISFPSSWVNWLGWTVDLRVRERENPWDFLPSLPSSCSVCIYLQFWLPPSGLSFWAMVTHLFPLSSLSWEWQHLLLIANLYPSLVSQIYYHLWSQFSVLFSLVFEIPRVPSISCLD